MANRRETRPNDHVDALIEDGVLSRTLALVEVSYSNSIIEAYWRSLKHQWLFLNSLDNLKALEKLVAFHVEQHNFMSSSTMWQCGNAALGISRPDTR